MELKKLDYAMTVCKVASELDIDLNKEFYFIGKTDEEYSLVCITEDTPIYLKYLVFLLIIILAFFLYQLSIQIIFL